MVKFDRFKFWMVLFNILLIPSSILTYIINANFNIMAVIFTLIFLTCISLCLSIEAIYLKIESINKRYF